MGRSRPNFSPKLEPIHRTRTLPEQVFSLTAYSTESQSYHSSRPGLLRLAVLYLFDEKSKLNLSPRPTSSNLVLLSNGPNIAHLVCPSGLRSPVTPRICVERIYTCIILFSMYFVH